MKLIAATAVVSSLVTYLNAAKPTTCLSPLIAGGSHEDMCIGYKKKMFQRVGCKSKAAKKLKVLDNGTLCVKERCLTYKDKKGKVVLKMSKTRKFPKVQMDYHPEKNCLQAFAPKAISLRYPKFWNGKINFDSSNTAEMVKCTIPKTTPKPTTPKPTTPKPTTPPGFKIFKGGVPDVNIIHSQNGNSVTVEMGEGSVWGQKFRVGSLLIHEPCNFYKMNIIKAQKYSNFGWGKADPALYNTWKGDLGQGKPGIGSFTAQHFGDKRVFEFLGDKSNNNIHMKDKIPKFFLTGDVISLTKTATFVKLEFNGAEYFRHTFRSNDLKELYPALDVHLTGDKYRLDLDIVE